MFYINLYKDLTLPKKKHPLLYIDSEKGKKKATWIYNFIGAAVVAKDTHGIH